MERRYWRSPWLNRASQSTVSPSKFCPFFLYYIFYSFSILKKVSVREDHLTISELETWLWDAACVIRGTADAPKYKDFILPLIFYKRLSDVFDDEFQQHVELYGSEEQAYEVIIADHQDALLNGRDQERIVRFLIPDEYRWIKLRNHAADSRLGEFVTDAMRTVAAKNPTLQGVLDVKDYNERQSGQRNLDDDRLAALIEVISRHRLGLSNTEPDILGRAYEYLLRKFAEGQGQSAGEFYTPKEVGWLIASLINPRPQSTSNLLRQEQSSHVGIHAKRLKAGWDHHYLQRVLGGVN